MLDLDRLTESFDWIDLGFLEREATPKPAMKLGIRLHVAGLSLSDTVSVLDAFGVDRRRSTVHKWVQKADQQPADGQSPNQVALDETVIWINDGQFWLFAAVDPETNYLLHMRCFRRGPPSPPGCFSMNYERNIRSTTSRSWSIEAPGSTPPSIGLDCDFDTSPTEIETPPNVSFEK